MSGAFGTPLLPDQQGRPLPVALEDAPFSREAAALPAVSFRDILRPLLRRFWSVLLIIAVALAGTFVYLLLTPPTYIATSKVLVHVGREKLSSLQVSGSPANNFVFNERPENVNDEIEILGSPTVLNNSLPQLQAKLEELAALSANQPPPQTLWEWAKYEVRQARRTLTNVGTWIIETLKAPLYAVGFSQRLPPEVALRERLARALSTSAVKETNVFLVGFGWSDPVFAAYALNTLLTAYEQEHVRVQANLAGAVDFYRQQQARAATELAQVTHDLDSFARSSGESDPVGSKHNAQALTEALERELTSAAVAVRQTSDRIATLRAQATSGAWPTTPGVAQENQSALADLDARYGVLTTNRSKLLAQYRGDSLTIAEIDAQIARLRVQKRQAVLGYLEDRLRVEQQAVDEIRSRLDQAHATLNRLSGIESGYLALQGRRDQLLSQMKEYQRVAEELMIQRALNAEDVSSVSILNKAQPPAFPSWPRKGLIMGLAALFSALLAIGYVMVLEFFDRTVSSERDLERVLGLPVVACVPQTRAP